MGRFSDALDALCQIPRAVGETGASVDRLTQSVQEARSVLPATHALSERLEELERAYTRILGEVEVLVDRAESKLAAARGAEERARGMQNRAEKLRESVEGDEAGEEPLDYIRSYIQAGDDPGGQENGVPDLRGGVDVPRHGKEAAKAFKWGGY